MTSGLYTAAMLAELVGVHVSRIRSWQRRGWLVPVQQTHRLAYFDFQELTVARQLAELQRGGATPRWLAKKLAQIASLTVRPVRPRGAPVGLTALTASPALANAPFRWEMALAPPGESTTSWAA